MAKAQKPVSRPCGICGKPVQERFKPFCSARCADVDLNRWLSGRYVIPGAEAPEHEEERRPARPDKDAD
jgi:endogenous inhibitor of DNA gyrase (YacG/DUF329 family)